MRYTLFILTFVVLSGCAPKHFTGYSQANKTLSVKDRKGYQLLSTSWKPYFNKIGTTSEDARLECIKSAKPVPRTELMGIFQLISCMQDKGFSISINEEIILNDRL